MKMTNDRLQIVAPMTEDTMNVEAIKTSLISNVVTAKPEEKVQGATLQA
ncbi:MAG: hypothetical protein ACJAYE_002356 [Candidatus Azotimanducaceae bacterium]|jgi:hypothetical protein